MRRVVWLLAAALGFGLAGCGKKFEAPPHPLSLKAPEEWTGGRSITGVSEARWWNYLGDQGLDGAIGTALEHNYDLRAAAARVEAAQAEARIAGADLRPTIDLNLNRGRQRQNFVGLPIPGREGSVLSTTYGSAGVNLALSWEPDVWGRIKSGEASALAMVGARESDVAASRLSLSGQVAKAWFAAIEAQRQVSLARATLASFNTSVTSIRERYERGLGPSLDLRLALTEVHRGNALVAQRQAQLDAAIRQIEILLGQYPEGEYALAEDLPRLPVHIPGGLPAELVHRRPDLMAVEKELLASDALVAQSRANLRPQFMITSQSGTASNTLRDLVDGEMLAWNLIAGLIQPVYNRGRLKAGVARDEAMVTEAMARYESSLLRAYAEVEIALAAENILARQEDALASATKQSLAARNLAEDRYRRGLADIITVLSSQRTALDSESQLLALRRQRLDNRVDLHLALGGGFEAPAAAPANELQQRSAADGPEEDL